MSTPAVPVLQPPDSIPARARAGDLLAWTVQTQLDPTFSVFYVLSALIALACAAGIFVAVCVYQMILSLIGA